MMSIDRKYDILNVKTIYLMMGFNCNFRCRHCIQDSCNTSIQKNNISKDVIDYLNRLINIRPTSYDKITIMFWGGEPLIYWNTIKDVIDIFHDKFSYSMVTNGSLLTQDKVDYINKYQIKVALSYDGKNTDKVRMVNVLQDKDKLELFKQIKNKSICAVSSAYNYDYQELYNHIDELIDTEIPVDIEQFRVTWDMPKDLYDIDLVEYRDKLHELAIQAKEDILNVKYSRPVSFFLKHLWGLCYTDKMYSLKCGQMYNKLNIDLQGNIYSCHNLCNPIGTVRDDRVSLVNKQDRWVSDNLPTNCKNCKYYIVCNGGCPNELIKDGERISCKINKVIFDEVFWLANELENSFMCVDLG